MGVIVSAFVSSTALLSAIILLAVPYLLQGSVSAIGVVAAIFASYLKAFLATGGFLIQFLIVLVSPAPRLRALPVEPETAIEQV